MCTAMEHSQSPTHATHSHSTLICHSLSLQIYHQQVTNCNSSFCTWGSPFGRPGISCRRCTSAEQFAISHPSCTINHYLLMRIEDIPSPIELCRRLSCLGSLYYPLRYYRLCKVLPQHFHDGVTIISSFVIIIIIIIATISYCRMTNLQTLWNSLTFLWLFVTLLSMLCYQHHVYILVTASHAMPVQILQKCSLSFNGQQRRYIWRHKAHNILLDTSTAANLKLADRHPFNSFFSTTTCVSRHQKG